MTFSLEQLAITDTETLDEVLECLAENFSIETQGACDQKTLFEGSGKYVVIALYASLEAL